MGAANLPSDRARVVSAVPKPALLQTASLPGVSHHMQAITSARVGSIHPGTRKAVGRISPRMAAIPACNAHGLTLLQCGDIEANPGPLQGDAQMHDPVLDQGALFLQAHRSGPYVCLGSPPDAGASNFAASSSSSSSPSGHPAVLSSATGRHAKQQASVSCPFVGCPSFRRHMSKDALVSHLSARHVASGQTVPDAVLRMVKHLACATCRTLYREGAHCQCHGQQIISDASVGVSHALPPPVHLAPGGMPTVPCTSLNAPCPALVPTLEELLASTVPTVRHIPNACRGPVSSCLSSLLEAFVLQRSWEALHRLQCFPKLVLRSSKRAGKAHAKQIASDIQRRLRLFNGGHLATLWNEATTVAQRP